MKATNKKAIRVYMIDTLTMPEKMWSEDVYKFTDERFITEATNHGRVFTLKGFEKAFNIGNGDDKYPEGIIRLI